MSARWVRTIALASGLAACSPSLNWRTVSVEQLAALMPCKPDHAERQVELAGTQHLLAMWGCEAGGALFAVSYLRVKTPATPQQLIAVWQQAALRKLPGATPLALDFKAPTMTGQLALPSVMVRATGKSADGRVVQAQLAWFSRGLDVYHLAVYAPELNLAMTDTFFTELHWE